MNDVIEWLLEDETPEIKYRVMVDLLDMPREDSSVKKAYDALIHSDAVNAATDKFKAGKKWEDFSAFSTLAEFGLTREDVPIDEYAERIITETNFNMMCGKGLLLRNLTALGYYGHSRVQEEIPKAFSVIREDGSFRCVSKQKNQTIRICRIWHATGKPPHISCLRRN